MKLDEVFLEALALGIWYDRYPWAIDGLIYLVLFTGVAKVSLGRRFAGRGGAAVVAAMGTALAVGAATMAHRAGFSLAALGGPAWLVLLTLLGLMLFDLLRSAGAGVLPAAAVSVLALVATASGLAPSLGDWLHSSGLAGVLRLLILVAMLILAWTLASALPRPGERRPHRNRPGAPVPETDEGAEERVAADSAENDEGTVAAVEQSILELLVRTLRRLRTGGIDRATGGLLSEVQRRERIVSTLFGRILRALAILGWRSTTTTMGEERDRLDPSLRDLLLATRDNIAAFEAQLRIARAAHDAGNLSLLIGAVERMIALEEAALRLCRELLDALRRLRRSGRRSRGSGAGVPGLIRG